MLRFFGHVEVVETSKELIESMIGGQMFVLVAEMVLAELPRGIALRLEQFCHRWVQVTNSLVSTG